MSHPAVLAAATNNFLIPNGTFIFEWIVFVLVVIFVAKKIYPRINELIERRQATIKQQFDDAEKAREDALKAKQEYENALAETRKEISRLREEANAERAQIIEEARSTARTEAEAVAEQERSRMATERQQVLLSLRTEIGELAFTLAEKLVRESLREEDRQRRLVDDFIAGVGATVSIEAESTHAGR
jgi:F-type H+-transporting ATPase subunit b